MDSWKSFSLGSRLSYLLPTVHAHARCKTPRTPRVTRSPVSGLLSRPSGRWMDGDAQVDPRSERSPSLWGAAAPRTAPGEGSWQAAPGCGLPSSAAVRPPQPGNPFSQRCGSALSRRCPLRPPTTLGVEALALVRDRAPPHALHAAAKSVGGGKILESEGKLARRVSPDRVLVLSPQTSGKQLATRCDASRFKSRRFVLRSLRTFHQHCTG
jgi:hypothetical protein